MDTDAVESTATAPYQLMPPLTAEEYEGLKASIRALRTVLVPILLDEHGTVLDGHHRIRAWTELRAEGGLIADYPRLVRPGLSEPQKRNLVRSVNLLRRHLTREQLKALMLDMRRDGATLVQIAEATETSVGSSMRQWRANFSVPKSWPARTGSDARPGTPRARTPA